MQECLFSQFDRAYSRLKPTGQSFVDKLLAHACRTEQDGIRQKQVEPIKIRSRGRALGKANHNATALPFGHNEWRVFKLFPFFFPEIAAHPASRLQPHVSAQPVILHSFCVVFDHTVREPNPA